MDPSPEIRARLAAERHTIAVHEAGHVVVGALCGIPLHEVWLAYRKGGLFSGGWWIQGRTEVAPNGGTVVGDVHDETLFNLGGVEAEAMHLAGLSGQRLTKTRRAVAGTRCNGTGDMPKVRDALSVRGNRFTLVTAQDAVHRLLVQHWPMVRSVADGLREHGRLDAREIYQLVGSPKGAR